MASKVLQTDQQNFVRVGIAVVDKIKLPLKDILETQIKPVDLYSAISSCQELLNGKYKLTPHQRIFCYIPPPIIPDYANFDVSLLYKLIKNLCPQLVPSQGWGKKPNATDLKIGDDIERLRLFRNDVFGHLTSSSIPDGLFFPNWKELEHAMKRMQIFLDSMGFNAVNYEEELVMIRRSDYGLKDMETYRLFLEVLTIIQQTQHEEFPTIAIRGDNYCKWGETVRFEAEVTSTSTFTLNWPITWHKDRGNIRERIDICKEKYTDSTCRSLVINYVSKEDQGDYLAILSGCFDSQHIKIESNVVTLKVNEDTSYNDENSVLKDMVNNTPQSIPTLPIQRFVIFLTNCASGQIECGESVEKMNRSIRDLHQASQRAISQSLQQMTNKSLLKADMSLNSEEEILEAAKSIASAVAALVNSASAVQRKLVAQGKVRMRREIGATYNKSQICNPDNQWSKGLISAAKLVAATTHSLYESANAMVEGHDTEKKLIATAKEVEVSTAHLLVACSVKADPNSVEMKKLQAAGNAVKRATEVLVIAAEQVKQRDEDEDIDVSVDFETIISRADFT